jgi:C4-dicarboxylate-specific signal transduction histidine kinase
VGWRDMDRVYVALSSKRGPVPYLVSAGVVLVTFLIRLALGPWIGQRSPLLPFIVSVVLAAGLYGPGPGLLAIGLSAVIATWAFIAPAGAVALSPEELVSIAVFLVAGSAMLLFANHLRETRERAEKLELQLQSAQANAAMGAMAATLAHELNQPLAAASNYVSACQQLALRLDEAAEPVVNGLGKADAQIQRAASIIRQARSLVRNLPVERDAASLRRMIGRVIDLVSATRAAENVRFQIDVRPEADTVAVNTIQIEQVLLNLIRNACQAIQLSGLPGDVSLKATSTDRGRFIEVRDTGPGIPRERIASLFSATQDSTAGGLGIGLSICRTIIEAHGGSIWAQNNPEGGASFFLLLAEPQ